MGVAPGVPDNSAHDLRIVSNGEAGRAVGSTMRTALLAWFAAEARPLPWRAGRRTVGASAADPMADALARDRTYVLWLVETMSQQTRIETVAARLPDFLRRFPDVATLAAADLDAVLAAWAGLGYYRRARALHAAAREVVGPQGGVWPSSVEGWAALPGVGPYTAAAIVAQAFGRPAIAVDGNVRRVGARLLAEPRPSDRHLAAALEARFFGPEAAGGGDRGRAEEAPRALGSVAEALHVPVSVAEALRVPVSVAEAPRAHGSVAEALVELGATVCTPRAPRCPACPLADDCAAAATGAPTDFPAPRRRSAPTRIELHAWIVLRGHPGAEADLALERRPDEGLWGGLHGLPWRSEAPPADAARLGRFEHRLTHRRVAATVWAAAAPPTASTLRWTPLSAVPAVGLAEIDQRALRLWRAATDAAAVDGDGR